MSLRSGQVTVTSTAVELLPLVIPVGWSSQLVVQAPASDVFVGPAGVTASTGLRIPAGGSLSFVLQYGEALFAVVASGSVTVSVLRSDF
jgi:hypothetical protein